MENGSPEQLDYQYRLLEPIYDGATFLDETLALLRADRLAGAASAQALYPTTMLWHANLVRHLRLYEEGPDLPMRYSPDSGFELASAYLVHRAPFRPEDMEEFREALRWDDTHPRTPPYTQYRSLALMEERYRLWLIGAEGADERLWSDRERETTRLACQQLRSSLAAILL